MINFRYRILKKLGEGGSGEVYLVEDSLRQRRQSAMKILHGGDRSDDAAVDQFRTEVSVLATLQHPNLTRVYDFGTIHQCDDPALEGRRFFTMECINGVRALEWWRTQRSSRDRVARLHHVVRQALGMLSYVHRQGIIHFDIKPDNLLLVQTGESDDPFPLLKVTDFGFSGRWDAALKFPLRGTLEYTAPELLRQEAFDHRVDLYSLGATLYHLIEDRCPFEAAEPVELIKKVLTTEPEFQRCAEAEFSSLFPIVRRLLHKDPAQRYLSAADAARELEGDRGAPAAAFDRLARPRFVGREKEKELIGSAIASLGAGAADHALTAIVVTGPEGIGKSSLLNEMVRIARATDVPVFDVHVLQRTVPFSGILSVLRMLRAEAMSRSPEGRDVMRKYADVIEGGGGSGDDDAAEQRVTWLREREKVVEAQARCINQVSLLFAFIIVVDDAQLLDPESYDVLRTVLRDARAGRVLILAAVREEEWQAIPALHFRLEELDAACVAAMSTSALPSVEVGEALGDRLYRVYGGSPGIIVEALLSVHAMLPGELPRRSSEVATLADHLLGQLPRDIDQLLFVRYKALERGPQLILDVLSAFALPTRLEILQDVLPFQPERTATYLSGLETDGLVAPHEKGQRVSMRHASLKSIVYAAIQEGRRDIHAFIASTLDRHAEVRTFADLQELAYQHRHAGMDAASVSWLEAAADEGARMGAFLPAEELLREAVALAAGSTPSALDRLNRKLAHAMFNCGELQEAVDLAEKLLGSGPREAAENLALHKTSGLAQSRLGQGEEAKVHFLAALQSCENPLEQLELQQELVGVEINLGLFAEAEHASAAQLDRAKALGNMRIIASIHTDLGIATFFQNLLDQSAAHFEEARKAYADSGLHAHLADAMMNIANVMSAKGDIVRAVNIWSTALKTSQEYGTLNQQAQIQNNLGIAHLKLEHFREAREYFDSAKAMFARLRSRQGSAFVFTNLGELNFAEGRYEHALTQWQSARQLYRDMDDGQGVVETLLQLAQVRLVVGDTASAGSMLNEAEGLMSERGLNTFTTRMLFLRGVHMLSLTRYDTARTFFEQARQASPDDPEQEQGLLLKVRMAECEYGLGELDASATLALSARDAGERLNLPHIVGEASFVLGTIAMSSPARVPERALAVFRRGLDAIAQEPVTEVTWKLAFALGQEFHKRGQSVKAQQCFTNARLVLQFFLAHFSSSELKNSYLAVDDKQKVLAALDMYLTR